LAHHVTARCESYNENAGKWNIGFAENLKIVFERAVG
jgi:hypothetical protein